MVCPQINMVIFINDISNSDFYYNRNYLEQISNATNNNRSGCINRAH